MGILHKIKWKLRDAKLRRLERRNIRTQRYTIEDCCIVAGSGRSGTTWVAETLSLGEGSTMVNEPLKNSNSFRVQQIGFTGWGQYIPTDAHWPEAEMFFDDLFSGSELNPNYFQGTPLKEVAETQKWIFKFIRIPFMLDWLTAKYELPPPVYIIRNPYAVISSQLRHVGFGKGRTFNPSRDTFIPQFAFYNEFYQEYFSLTRSLKNYTEKLALHWALQNKYVLTGTNSHRAWKIKTYEELLMNPIKEFSDMARHFDLPQHEFTAERLKFESSSTVTKPDLDNPESQLTNWKNRLSNEDVESISRILKLTDFEIYSPDDPMIRRDKLILPIRD